MPDSPPVLTPAPSEPRPARYRPVSALALVAFVVAGLYALVVGVFGTVAFLSGMTLFMGLWVLLFPVLALILSVLARQRIRRSDGAFGGEALASWAWWLSVVFGFGYGAYYFGTYLAVREQAEAFTRNWFAKIQEGKIEEAFLLTQDPAQRKFEKTVDPTAVFLRYGITPLSAGTKPPLIAFGQKQIVELFREAGKDVDIHPLGVKDWNYDQGGYRVVQSFLINTPLASFDVEIPIVGRESREFEGRQWAILSAETKVASFALTPLGKVAEAWRQHARAFVSDWLTALHGERNASVYLDTLPPSKRDSVQRRMILQGVVNDLAGYASLLAQAAVCGPFLHPAQPAFIADPEWQRTIYLEGYPDFLAGRHIATDHLLARPEIRVQLSREAKALFRHPVLFAIRMDIGRSTVEPTGVDPAFLRVGHEVTLSVFPEQSSTDHANYICDVEVITQSDISPAKSDKIPKWQVVGIRVLRGRVPDERGAAAEQAAPPRAAPAPSSPPAGTQ